MWFVTLVFRNIWQRKIRSLLTCLGIAIAVAAITTMVGISRGFEESLSKMFDAGSKDVIVSRARSPQRLASTLDEKIGERLKLLPGVQAVEPMLVDVVSFENTNLIAVYVFGLLPEGEMVREYVLNTGRALKEGEKQTIILGQLLAHTLGKKTGDRLELNGRDVEVVGVFGSKNMFERGAAVVSLHELQRLMGIPGRVTTFLIQLSPPYKTAEKMRELCQAIDQMTDDQGQSLSLAALPSDEHVRTNAELLMFRAMAWTTSSIALLIGIIGVLNTMMISVFERTLEIGTLRAVGWKKSRIVRLILLEALFLSIGGALLGVGMSMVMTTILSRIEATAMFVPSVVGIDIILEASFLALFAGMAGSIVPAMRAASMLPTAALRHQ